jgi:hypothetical protein
MLKESPVICSISVVIKGMVPQRTAPLADVEYPDVYLLGDQACNISGTASMPTLRHKGTEYLEALGVCVTLLTALYPNARPYRYVNNAAKPRDAALSQ